METLQKEFFKLIKYNSMTDKINTLRVLVVGCGNMGASHAAAYHDLEGFEICGLVSKGTKPWIYVECS
ncbi:Gfo/Idh/MocA family oxidoreductase [Antarcticibacterium sp. 1MA-6-2]|uniref:Gfo/Idh/MocA family oxidoreductase n=1 Tax=Antarcticibacterium sp. 1MA-6-2 TaxID=2908210 RepID=UPI001F28F286|nr:Gfo/Idh/MocA family oxidoreductase [Antarcticibacterium sp. 1MA-6-2]UJH90098.1 Gfo/Idh/MocA family oxidoreductase [Antarcticibacterium sp. 1MA-6-2]